MKNIALFLVLASFSLNGWSQGSLTGDVMANVNFYNYDPAINATNVLYRNYLSGGESWLSLRYANKGFTATVRVDAFHNSNLYNPSEAQTNFGIGAFSLSKEVQNLTITGGYIYDQIGSGLLFRAYEDRGLLIDNALVGLHLRYRLTDNIRMKAFTGQQKNVFTFGRFDPVIKGFNAEGDFSIGKVQLSPGIGAINRTLDANTLLSIQSSVDNQDTSNRFTPRFNMYGFTVYNTLTSGDFSWYVEGAYKTHEAIFNTQAYNDVPGNVVFSTLSYARKGIAVNLTGKRTENFLMKAQPTEIVFRGILNWQPIVARLRPQRLMARYTPASQDLSEIAGGGDVLISPNENLDLTFNYTHINTLGDTLLYREAYAEAEYRGFKKWIIQGGVQVLRYNQALYQVRPDAPIVEAVTPFAEVTYRLSDTKSLKAQVEYMHTEQDFGSWVFALLEFSIAPKWSFAVSDMYITKLNPDNYADMKEPQHFYNLFVAHTRGPNRFTAAYVRQVEGINCTGGVCRYEPAFSGFKMTVTSSF